MLKKFINILKSNLVLVLSSVAFYTIPFLNFNLYFLHCLFLLTIFYSLKYKNSCPIRIGLLFGISSSLIGQYWLTETLMRLADISILNGFLIHAIYSLYESSFFILIFFLIKKLIISNKKEYTITYLIIIFVWICIENIFPRVFPYKLGNSQITFSLINNIISFFGLNLLSIFVLVINIIIFHFYFIIKNSKCLYLIITLLVSGIYISNDNQIDKYKENKKISVAIIQPNNMKENLKKLSVLNIKDTDLIVWPESSIDFINFDSPSYIKSFQKNFNKKYAFNANKLIFGSITKKNNNYFNSGIIIDNKNNFIDVKNKKRLLIYGEYYPFKNIISYIIPIYDNFKDLTSGSNKAINITDSLKAFIFICYEDLFASDIVKINKDKDIGLIINITNDIWYGESLAAYQHLMLSIPRAIESNRFFIRSANNGVSALISPSGKIIEKIDLNTEGRIDYKIPILEERSFYHSYYLIIEISYYLILIILFMVNKIFYTRKN